MERSDHFIVLGASSWIGHYLVPTLRTLNSETRITALYRQSKPSFQVTGVEIVRALDVTECLNSLATGTVINISRGEDESDFLTHSSIIDLQNRRNARYLYASSSNAVDADVSKSHSEDDKPKSQSDYGKFKARCEIEMLEKCDSPLIFRFSATHGWAPNRVARTHEFLLKLQKGEEIKVARGIVQNRSFVGDLAKQIAMLSSDSNLTGTFHLGTCDFSEEIDFLRNMAVGFGYDRESIAEEGENPWNAVMEMRALKRAFPSYSIPSEREAIIQVVKQPEFAIFKQ